MKDEKTFAREEGGKGMGDGACHPCCGRVPAVFTERSGGIKGEDLEVAGLEVACG